MNVKELAKMFTAVPEMGIWTAESYDPAKLRKTMKVCKCNVPEEDVIAFIDVDVFRNFVKKETRMSFCDIFSLSVFLGKIAAKLCHTGGLVVTTKAIYGLHTFFAYRYTFREGMKIQFGDHESILINGAEIGTIVEAMSPFLKKFFEELQGYVQQMKTEDFAPCVVNNPLFEIAKSFTPVVADHIFVYPDIIDDARLKNAIKRYAPEVSPDEVLVLIDSSLTLSGNDGLLMTRTGLYSRTLTENRFEFDRQILTSLSSISLRRGLQITAQKSTLCIDGSAFAHLNLDEEPLCRFTAELQKYVDSLEVEENAAEHYFTHAPLNGIYAAPDIPQDKLDVAINAFATGESKKDVLLLFFSNGIYGLFKQVLLLTSSKLYVRDFGVKIVYPVRSDLKISLEGKNILINGEPILKLNSEELNLMLRLVAELQKYVAEHGAVVSESDVVFTPTKNIHVAPAIPQAKLNNAIQSYANDISAQDVLLLFDNALFETGKSGLLLTSSKLYVDSRGKKVYPLRNDMKITFEKKYILINGEKVLFGTVNSAPIQQLAAELQKYVNALN